LAQALQSQQQVQLLLEQEFVQEEQVQELMPSRINILLSIEFGIFI
jgi:hypothetical protein